MRHWLDSGDVGVTASGDGVEVTPLFGEASGCEPFEQRLLAFAGASAERCDDARDEVLYVLAGTGAATVGRELYELEAGARRLRWPAERRGGSRSRPGCASSRCS